MPEALPCITNVRVLNLHSCVGQRSLQLLLSLSNVPNADVFPRRTEYNVSRLTDPEQGECPGRYF